ncbi:hypothetical protein L3X38_010039 [Prunus dulcis]|uniref:Uncharacterized protein n=1 Tax=Prunus dulcis TaxID=3755 RepID=A0AAD4WF32_PRUDU|nr:hypothetical protein L3X38_010039 [Prunus dulcis]
MAKVMMSLKEINQSTKDMRVAIMMVDTSTIKTPARRAWFKEKQNKIMVIMVIMAKEASHSLNFNHDVYQPELPSDDSK